MIHYLDRTFCPTRSCTRTDCPLSFDEDKYRATCERIGFDMDVAFLTEQPNCPEQPLSTRGLAVRTGRRRRERELLRQMKGSSR